MRCILLLAFLALTGLAYADTGGDISDDINNVICLFVRLIWLVTGSLMALVIIFAGVKWLVSGDDAGARASAKTFIISAFVGLIIIFTAVPVVDYLVGSTLGYGFECGFFPEVDSVALNARSTEGSTEKEVLRPMSVDDPLSSLPDLSLSSISLSGDPEGSGDELSVCFVVSEISGKSSVEDVPVSAYLIDAGGNSFEVCSGLIAHIDRGASKNFACEVRDEVREKMRSCSGGCSLEAWVDCPYEVEGGRVLESDDDSTKGILSSVSNGAMLLSDADTEINNMLLYPSLSAVPVDGGCTPLRVLSTNMAAVLYAGTSRGGMKSMECGSMHNSQLDAYAHQPVYLDGSQSTAWSGCPIVKYTWFVDDQPVYESKSPYHELVFDSPGTRNIRLEITAVGSGYTYTRDSGRCARIIVKEKPVESPAQPKLTLLFIPIDWQGDVSGFEAFALNLKNQFVQKIPLKYCPESLVAKVYPQNCVYNLPMTYDACWNGFDGFMGALKSCANSFGEPYDYVVGLTNKEGACESSSFTGTAYDTMLIYGPDSGGLRALMHELGHKFGLNDEYYDTCRCFPNRMRGNFNCLTEELGGGDKSRDYQENFCAGSGRCPANRYDGLCYGHWNRFGTERCVMGDTTRGLGPESYEYCQLCWDHMDDLDFLTCAGV